MSFSSVDSSCIDSLVCADGKFSRKRWSDIVLTLHFSRWHVFQTPEATTTISAYSDYGEDNDGFCGFVLWLRGLRISQTSLCSICHSSGIDISIAHTPNMLIITSWDRRRADVQRRVSTCLRVQAVVYSTHPPTHTHTELRFSKQRSMWQQQKKPHRVHLYMQI